MPRERESVFCRDKVFERVYMLQKMVLYPCLTYKQHYGLSRIKKKKDHMKLGGKSGGGHRGDSRAERIERWI